MPQSVYIGCGFFYVLGIAKPGVYGRIGKPG